ncbi:hypothetical protein MMOR_28120 [Mycolicibacterium moriokaense]|jgi:hypothetical protein|uniref:Uncharacterized protein n=1 Tax=Mycolicibacterium moriokaense TaxID=39691 RepID=A0AAD1M6Y6_9MYCO|nr:hypothetical protein MMOR_28120 [Mycolicibacterium moriokaense]
MASFPPAAAGRDETIVPNAREVDLAAVSPGTSRSARVRTAATAELGELSAYQVEASTCARHSCSRWWSASP